MTLAKITVIATMQPPEISVIAWPIEDERIEEKLKLKDVHLNLCMSEFTKALVELHDEVILEHENNMIKTNKNVYCALFSDQLQKMKVGESISDN